MKKVSKVGIFHVKIYSNLPFGIPVVCYQGQIMILQEFWNPLYTGKLCHLSPISFL